MKCEEAKMHLPDYWSQTLRAAEELELEAHLADCTACREENGRLHGMWQALAQMPQEEPDSKLRGRFYEALGAYRQGVESRAAASKWRLQIAAGFALLGIGLATGYAVRPADTNTGKQVAELREEVTGMRQMVALSLLQQQSASERLRGVSFAYRAEPSDTETLSALVSAINNDANVNVRLAAVDALHTFSNSPTARQAVMESLPLQNNTPLVQVALIDLLVELKEREAAAELRRMADDDAVNDGVKQRALWALENLQ